MALIQLEDPIEVNTPVGHGFAVVLEADALDHWWTVILDSGAFVTMKQNKLRAIRSYTHGRGVTHEEMKEITK